MGSYLTLPAVDLEALKAEFQDDGPASGTVLGEREGVRGKCYLPGPAQPSLSTSHHRLVSQLYPA